MTPLEQAERDLAECLLARLVFVPDGAKFSGAHLLAFRSLPERDKLYFAALTAPLWDEHGATRTRTVSLPDEDGFCEVTHDPPYPKVCACKAPVYADWNTQWARCAECLCEFHAFFAERESGWVRQRLSFPLAEHVEKPWIGRFAERDRK